MSNSKHIRVYVSAELKEKMEAAVEADPVHGHISSWIRQLIVNALEETGHLSPAWGKERA